MANPNKYPYARPFDIVRTVQGIQSDVKQMQVRNSGRTGAWTVMTLSNGWTGTLSVRIQTGNQLQLSAKGLVPGTISTGVLLATLSADMIPPTAHEIALTTDVLNAAIGSPRCAIHVDGTMNLFGIAATVGELSMEATIPLDI